MSTCLGHGTWIRSTYKNTTWYWVISGSYYKFCSMVLRPEISVKLCINYCVLWHTPKVLVTEWQVRVWLGIHWFMSESTREVKGITRSRKERENIIGRLISELRSAWPCPDEIWLFIWMFSVIEQSRKELIIYGWLVPCHIVILILRVKNVRKVVLGHGMSNTFSFNLVCYKILARELL